MTLDEIIMWGLHFTLWACIFALAYYYREKLFIAALIVRHICRAVIKGCRAEHAERKAIRIEKKRKHRRKDREIEIAKLTKRMEDLRKRRISLQAEAIDDLRAERKEEKKNDPAPLQQCRTYEDVRLNTIFLVYSNTNKPKSQDKG